jgi:sugar-specific transcriptional regulator TrmB
MYQPQKNNDINNKKSNLNDLKKNEKRESNYHLKTEIEKSKENNSKINSTNNSYYTGRENIKHKNQNVFDSIKKMIKRFLHLKKRKKFLLTRLIIAMYQK